MAKVIGLLSVRLALVSSGIAVAGEGAQVVHVRAGAEAAAGAGYHDYSDARVVGARLKQISCFSARIYEELNSLKVRSTQGR